MMFFSLDPSTVSPFKEHLHSILSVLLGRQGLPQPGPSHSIWAPHAFSHTAFLSAWGIHSFVHPVNADVSFKNKLGCHFFMTSCQ